MPRQIDMPIEGFPDCLNNIALIQLAVAATDSKYVLVGSSLKKLLGEDPTNKTLRQIYSKEIAEEVGAALMKVVINRSPSFYLREFQVLGQCFGYYRLLLPLRVSDMSVQRVLVGLYPTRSTLRQAWQWRSVVDNLNRQQAEERRLAKAWADGLRGVVVIDENEPDRL